MIRQGLLTVLVTGGMLAAACGAAPTAQPGSSEKPTVAAAASPTASLPTATVAAPSPTAAMQASKPEEQQAQGEPQSWLDIFPNAEGRDLVLQNCGTCHGFDRIVLGQRSQDRWESVKSGHRERTPGISDADYDKLFAYLAAHFNPSNPEPKIPAHLMGPSSAE